MALETLVFPLINLSHVDKPVKWFLFASTPVLFIAIYINVMKRRLPPLPDLSGLRKPSETTRITPPVQKSQNQQLLMLIDKLIQKTSEDKGSRAELWESLRYVQDQLSELKQNSDSRMKSFATILKEQSDLQVIRRLEKKVKHLESQLQDTQDQTHSYAEKVRDTLYQQTDQISQYGDDIRDLRFQTTSIREDHKIIHSRLSQLTQSQTGFKHRLDDLNTSVQKTQDLLNTPNLGMFQKENVVKKKRSGVDIKTEAMNNNDLPKNSDIHFLAKLRKPYVTKGLAASGIFLVLTALTGAILGISRPISSDNIEISETRRNLSPLQDNIERTSGYTRFEDNGNDDLSAIDISNPDLVSQLANIEPGGYQDTFKTSQYTASDYSLEEAKRIYLGSEPVSLKGQSPTDPRLPQSFKTLEEYANTHNSGEAQHDLGTLYAAGYDTGEGSTGEAVPQDFLRAAYWFDRSARNHITNAAYNLGVLYHQGLGVSKDIDRAILLYKTASADNHGEAAYNLAISYMEGVSVARDTQKAQSYFQIAAAQDVEEAGYNLGALLEYQADSQEQRLEALYWYRRSAKAGVEGAGAAYEKLASSLNMRKEDLDRALNNIALNLPAPKKLKNALIGKGTEDDRIGDETALYHNNSNLSDPKSASDGQKLTIARIQDYLMALGYYSGQSDGIAGRQTQAAVKSYQKAHNLPATGQADEDLLIHMMIREEDDSLIKPYNDALLTPLYQ